MTTSDVQDTEKRNRECGKQIFSSDMQIYQSAGQIHRDEQEIWFKESHFARNEEICQ